MLTTELIISGRVQGVGYRYYAKTLADELNINGTVRNLSDGNVKVIAQTNEDILEQFIARLKIPQHALMRVDSIITNKINIDKVYQTFSIVY